MIIRPREVKNTYFISPTQISCEAVYARGREYDAEPTMEYYAFVDNEWRGITKKSYNKMQKSGIFFEAEYCNYNSEDY